MAGTLGTCDVFSLIDKPTWQHEEKIQLNLFKLIYLMSHNHFGEMINSLHCSVDYKLSVQLILSTKMNLSSFKN